MLLYVRFERQEETVLKELETEEKVCRKHRQFLK